MCVLEIEAKNKKSETKIKQITVDGLTHYHFILSDSTHSTLTSQVQLDNLPVDFFTADLHKGQFSGNFHAVIYCIRLGWLDYFNHTKNT